MFHYIDKLYYKIQKKNKVKYASITKQRKEEKKKAKNGYLYLPTDKTITTMKKIFHIDGSHSLEPFQQPIYEYVEQFKNKNTIDKIQNKSNKIENKSDKIESKTMRIPKNNDKKDNHIRTVQLIV